MQEGVVPANRVDWCVTAEQLLTGGEGDLEMEVISDWYMHRYISG